MFNDIHDPHFKAVYNPTIVQQLEKQFGPITHHHEKLSISTRWMLDMMTKMEQKPRRGEIVMVIPNEKGKIWLHTKAFYPNGVYRLMTGGLEQGENPLQACKREIVEETGFKTKIDRCLAIITYHLQAEVTHIPFVSYVFTTPPISEHPTPTDPSEAISDFQTFSIAQLDEIIRQLYGLKGDTADWGHFRAIAHEVVQKNYIT